jgi:hypothetical protein
MGQSASQAHTFYRDVGKNRRLWTCRDDGGFPQPETSFGCRAQPFWSSLSRVQRIIKNVPDYGIFVPHELTWDEFLTKWVPDLKAHGVKVGVNWSGKGAVGYDLEPDDVVKAVEAYIQEIQYDEIDKDLRDGGDDEDYTND